MATRGKLSDQGYAMSAQPAEQAPVTKPAEDDLTDAEFKHPPWLDAAKLNAELCRAVEKEIRAVRAATKVRMPAYPEGPAKTPTSPPRANDGLSPVRVCSRSPLCKAISDRMNTEDMLLVPSGEVVISPKSGRPRSPRESGDDYALNDLAGTNLKTVSQSIKHIGRKMQDAWLVEQPGIRKSSNTRSRSASKSRTRARSSSAGATKRPPTAKKRPASPKRTKKKGDAKLVEKALEFSDGVSDALPSAVGGADTIPSGYSETQPSDGEMTGSVDPSEGRAQVTRNVPKRLSDQEFTRGMEAAFANVTPYHTKVKHMSSRHASDASSSSGGFNVGLRSRSRSRSRDSRGRREGSADRKTHHSPTHRTARRREVSPHRPSIESVSGSEVSGPFSAQDQQFASAIFPMEHIGQKRDSVESVPSSVDDGQTEVPSSPKAVTLSTLSKLQQENVRLQTMVVALQTQSNEGSGTALADLANTVATLQAQLEREKRRPVHQHEEFKAMQQENAVLRSKVDQAILLRDKIELAVDALKQKDAVIYELERRLLAAQQQTRNKPTTPSPLSPPSSASTDVAEYQRINAQLREHNIALSRELKKLMDKDGQSSVQRSERSEEITYSAPETEGIREQLASAKRRCEELQELYDDEALLRKRAEKKCQELKDKCTQLEREALEINQALEESGGVITEQMATLNGLKDELIRLRRFRNKILAQDEAIGDSASAVSLPSQPGRLDSQVSEALPPQRVMTVSQLESSSSIQSVSSRTESGLVSFSGKPPSVAEDNRSVLSESKLQFQRSATDYSLSVDGSVACHQQVVSSRSPTPDTTASTRSSLHSLQAECEKPTQAFRHTGSLSSSPVGPSRPLHEEEAQDGSDSYAETITSIDECNPTSAETKDHTEFSEEESDAVSSAKHSFPSTSQSSGDKRGKSRKDNGESVYSITAAQFGTSHRQELSTLFRKYGDADGAGLMQFTQFTQAAKVVPTQCSNHDVFMVFRSMAHASEEQPYSKILNCDEFCIAVRKLANWCYARYKCDGDYRCASADLSSQALEMLLKRL